MPIRRATVGLLLVAAALTACENVPYYGESLDWFSRSRYDPEVRAIEQRTPQPQDSPVISAPTGAAATLPMAGGATLAAASPGIEGPGAVVARAASSDPGPASAILPPQPRITPPMGLARTKRVIYGGNRGPFETGSMRTLP
jgi:hypothetical protein